MYALQGMGGWSSTDMVRRCAQLAADHLTPCAERLGGLCDMEAGIDGTNLSQAGADKKKAPRSRDLSA